MWTHKVASVFMQARKYRNLSSPLNLLYCHGPGVHVLVTRCVMSLVLLAKYGQSLVK